MRFLLETDAVSNAASGISKLSSNVSSISCDKYKIDVEPGDGIDFSSARNALAANVSACADRMKVTGTVLNEVVSQHTQLQKSLTFENYLNPPVEEKDSGSDYTYAGGRRGSSGYRSSGRSSNSAYRNAIKDVSKSDSENFIGSVVSSLGIARTSAIDKLTYANVDNSKLSDESKKVMKAVDKNNKNGYLMINGRYVIACTSDVGNVGDVLRFKSKDGKIVECVVGINTVTKENSKKVFLLVNDNKLAKAVNFGDIITDNKTTITTIGTYTDNNLGNKTKVINGIAGAGKEVSGIANEVAKENTNETPTNEQNTTTENSDTKLETTESTPATETTEKIDNNEGGGIYV